MATSMLYAFSPTRAAILLPVCRKCFQEKIVSSSRGRAAVFARLAHSNPWADNLGKHEISIPVGDRSIKIKTGQLARFTDGCAVAECGHTSVMVTAVSKTSPSPANFLPLTVDYRQKAAAAGRIPTNYLRRELGVTDKEILTSRMIDRSIRPLFPEDYFCETQIVCNLLAVDGINDPEIASVNAASAALAVSDIPWDGPIGAVRVGLIDGDVVINPTRHELNTSSLNLVVSATHSEKIVMLEAGGERVPQPNFLKAIKAGVKQCQKIVNDIQDLQTAVGKPKRPLPEDIVVDPSVREAISNLCYTRIRDVFTDPSHHKISRDQAISAIREDVLFKLTENFKDVPPPLLARELNSFIKDVFRDLILDTSVRCDGRGLTDLRSISCQVDMFPPLHGSALFQRGQTQVLSTVTFDSPESAAKVDTISALTGGIKEKNFFLHYEFPPYATNETGRGNVGRRELGHGALAEKALRPVVPSSYPFTIRLTAEVLESNGSSSMASACGGSLALMDAGVPISEPVAGVAIGLITRSDSESKEISQHAILTDLLGIEDYLGDMDFKMAGTKTGITALQADIKLRGVPMDIIMSAVQHATAGKNKILSIMNQVQSRPRVGKKDNSPVIEEIEVPVHKRARFLGVGGHNLRKLKSEIGVTISPIDDQKFQIFAPNSTALDEAREKIESLLSEEKEPTLDFGGIYKATIVEIKDFGVMVQLYPSMAPALIHNSQLDQRKVNHPSALGMVVGQELDVKYFGRDPNDGRVRLSRKVLQSPATSIIKSLNSNSNSQGS